MCGFNLFAWCAETMTITVYLTKAGVKDEGGVEQPAYLNFEATLNQLPEHSLKVHSWPTQMPVALDKGTYICREPI